MIIFCHAIMKKASLIVKQSEVIAFLNIYILNKYNLSVALVVYGGVWMDYKTFGPLIMTHFLFAHPVGSPPSPFTHTHTHTHSGAAAAHTHCPLGNFPQRGGYFTAEKRDCRPMCIFSVLTRLKCPSRGPEGRFYKPVIGFIPLSVSPAADVAICLTFSSKALE